MTTRWRLAMVGAVLVGLGAVTGCGDPEPVTPVLARNAAGDATRGRQVAIDNGCGSCHRIPGVPNSDDALVGPPLDSWSRRSYVAGSMPNSPDNLARWIADPQEIEPGTAMPTLDLDESEVADLVAYLFTLE